jgi:hypothetical protein
MTAFDDWRAGGARRNLCAPSVRELEMNWQSRGFHLWLPSLRISDAHFQHITDKLVSVI